MYRSTEGKMDEQHFYVLPKPCLRMTKEYLYFNI